MLAGVFLPAGVGFTFLPDPVDIGFVGTGSAIGGLVGGLWAYVQGSTLEEIATQAGALALAGGTVAGLVWLGGFVGIGLP